MEDPGSQFLNEVFNLNKSYFNKLTKDLLFLDTYDEMENFILSNF
jgi:hypothetical protein